MVRILHIGLSYDYGGIESFVMNYFRAIDKEKYQFDFINPYDNPLAYTKDIMEMGGKIYYLPDFHKNPYKYKQTLEKIVKNYKIVHIHMLSAANMIPLKVAKKCGIDKIIVHAHNTKAEGKLRSILHYIQYKKICKLTNCMLACSVEAGKWMFGKKCSFDVMKNAILTENYEFSIEKRKKIRDELHIDENTIIYGNVGRLNVQKNQIFLIRIFYEIQQRNSDSVLCIVGIGEKEKEIRDLINHLNIQNKVFMMGRRKDMDFIYNAFDVVILPSLFEGLPIMLIEAQANGLKCYVSNRAVPQESKILDTFCFLDLEIGEKKWAEKILSDKNVRIVNAGNILREKNYDITIESKKLENYYNRVND